MLLLKPDFAQNRAARCATRYLTTVKTMMIIGSRENYEVSMGVGTLNCPELRFTNPVLNVM